MAVPKCLRRVLCTATSLLVVALLCCFVSTSQAQQPGTTPVEGLRPRPVQVYALTDARIVPAPGEVIESGTVIIRGEKIHAIGPADSVDIPADAKIIRLDGHTIYPGMIDAYDEQDLDREWIAAGSPYWNTYVTPQADVSRQLEANAEINESLRSQGFVARLVAPAAGILRGSSVLALTTDESPSQTILNDRVAQHARLTVSRRRDENASRYPNSPMGAVALARQAFYDAIWYRDANAAAQADSLLDRPERNDALAALQPLLNGSEQLIFSTGNELYTLRADRFAREFGLRAILLGSGNEYRRLQEVVATHRPIIVPVDYPQPPNVATAEAAASVSLESLMHWDHAPENPGRLAAAGATIMFTSFGLEQRDDFLDAIRTAVARGLPADDALRALTINPAEQFGVASHLGQLAKGKLACLTICTGDLFAEETTIVETWVRGHRYQIVSEPTRQTAGSWILDLERISGKPSQLWLEIEQDGDDLSGDVIYDRSDESARIKLSQVDLIGGRFSATFSARDLGISGVARLSAVLESQPDGWIGAGHMTWPDGTRSEVTCRLDTNNSHSESDADASPGKDGDDSTTADSVKSNAASFEVNYPLGGFGRTAPPPQPPYAVFRNATVWTCGEAGILPETDVLIGAGKILAIGTGLEVPEGCLEVDAENMHITPGIIDCHSHMATDGGVNESGQAITAEVRIGDFIDCDDITIYRQLAGGVTCSNILHGSANPIGGQNQVIKLRWGALDEDMKFNLAPEGIKFALGENVKQSNRGEEFTTRYPQTRMGVEQIMRDEFNAALEYAARWREWKSQPSGMPPRRDLQLEAMAEILAGDRWIHCHSYRQDEILALIRTLDDYEITIGTFQHILEGYKVADAMAAHGAMGSAFSDWWAYKVEVYDAIPFAGALMHEAGVVVSFNSDDGELATHLNHEAAKAVKYGGVDPHEALKFVTLNPARQLRIEEYVGSIEVGKDADLAVWSAPPLSTLSRCEQTWVDGRKYFDRSNDIAQRQQIRAARNTLIQKVLASGESMREPGELVDDPSRLWPREDVFCHGHGHDDDAGAWYLLLGDHAHHHKGDDH